MQTRYLHNPLTGEVRAIIGRNEADRLRRYGWTYVKAAAYRAYIVNRALRLRPLTQIAATRH